MFYMVLYPPPGEKRTPPLPNFIDVNDSQTNGGEIATITQTCLVQELNWLCCIKRLS